MKEDSHQRGYEVNESERVSEREREREGGGQPDSQIVARGKGGCCGIDIHWARFYGPSLRLLTWIAGEVRRKIRGTLFWWSVLYNVAMVSWQPPLIRFSRGRYIGKVEKKKKKKKSRFDNRVDNTARRQREKGERVRENIFFMGSLRCFYDPLLHPLRHIFLIICLARYFCTAL